MYTVPTGIKYDLEQRFSAGCDFALGNIWLTDVFDCPNWSSATDIQWVGARDAAKYLQCRGQPPHKELSDLKYQQC